MKIEPLIVVILGLAPCLTGADIETLHLVPAAKMERADLCYMMPVANPKAVLILCPGSNGNADGSICSSAWQEFARSNNLGLVGLSFASPIDHINDVGSYYFAPMGSGDKLMEGIRKIFGKDLPLLLYGFSGGAHFVSRFEQWKPDRVLCWCADAGGFWDTPQHHTSNPPGIVACGESDPRLGGSLIYFKQGRAIGNSWTWICLPKTGHQGSPALDDFVRKYFESILQIKKPLDLPRSLWVDVDTMQAISESEAKALPSESAWLPNPSLIDDWRKIYAP